MRKPVFCICENKDADQLRGNREADQRLCFRYTDSTIPLLPKSEISSLLPFFCGCTARFVSETPKNRFSQNEAQQCRLGLSSLSDKIEKLAWKFTHYENVYLFDAFIGISFLQICLPITQNRVKSNE